MFVSLSITLEIFKFLTLVVALVGTNNAGVTSDGFKGSRPLLKPEKYKKNFLQIKVIAIAEARSIACSDLTIKYSVGAATNISKLSFFVNADESG